ncbi:hypothetical protein J3T78_02525 [Staphylococcus nepalensis]|uniref:Uncharacterized protein n=1 Tax=Staphylococcus nepalensis TaxID=214473 RepID=A0ABS3L3R3_9STAP|nr:hypothetical protein [Staphylococcus nepalensis]MBO1214121.1 hypothetical protein [Staphylococcus nepalensis]MBO1217386.1 hypothetical protein [Staphylococcus nepalensis]MBO1228196.1 hypothetical protein [Staphylococcus nepalensis]MBO1233728.1 hypothetical protein [Staphylococcus nepalensis]MBO1236583.1 hypothetical protein [Staphylococcus nepalensis]
MNNSYTDEEMDIIQNSLEQLSSDDKRLCSCDFAMLEPERHKVTLPFAESGFPLQGLKMVVVTCNNCCKAHLFSAKMLGLN